MSFPTSSFHTQACLLNGEFYDPADSFLPASLSNLRSAKVRKLSREAITINYSRLSIS